jgi:hypothetical protein
MKGPYKMNSTIGWEQAPLPRTGGAPERTVARFSYARRACQSAWLMMRTDYACPLLVYPQTTSPACAPSIATPFNETHGQISPDGKWFAQASNSTGRNEIYVQPFPEGSGGRSLFTAAIDRAGVATVENSLPRHQSVPDLRAFTGSFRFGLIYAAPATARGGGPPGGTRPRRPYMEVAINWAAGLKK